MDRVVLEQKLESLRRCVTRVQAKRPANLEALIADPDAQDVIVLNLSRAVQLCVDIAAPPGQLRFTGASNNGASV